MQNYFEYFGIPIAYEINVDQLRKLYYQKSREIHPDLNLNAAEQEFQSAFTNQAYKTLLNPFSRLKYIIELVSGPIDLHKNMDAAFLLEVMELNETIHEAKQNQNDSALKQATQAIDQLQNEALLHIEPYIRAFDKGQREQEILDAMQLYYYKLRYFLRIRQSLSGEEREL